MFNEVANDQDFVKLQGRLDKGGWKTSNTVFIIRKKTIWAPAFVSISILVTMALFSSVFMLQLSSLLGQNLVQKWTFLDRKSKGEFARLVFLFALKRSIFGPDRFWPKDHNFRFIKRETRGLKRHWAQISNKLIIHLCLTRL